MTQDPPPRRVFFFQRAGIHSIAFSGLKIGS
jgi:hypothetical protein